MDKCELVVYVNEIVLDVVELVSEGVKIVLDVVKIVLDGNDMILVEEVTRVFGVIRVPKVPRVPRVFGLPGLLRVRGKVSRLVINPNFLKWGNNSVVSLINYGRKQSAN